MNKNDEDSTPFDPRILPKALSIILFIGTSIFFFMVLSDLDLQKDLVDLFSMKYAMFGSFEFGKDGLFFFTYSIAGYLLSVIFAINSSWVKWEKMWVRCIVTFLLLCIFCIIASIPSVITPAV